MKTRETIPGRTYSVHSTAGCTVSDDSGWSKTLEAPEDYFTAHRSNVYIDDDAATVRELFKLAPQQRLALLGVLGGDKLPAGYTRLGYLESTGTQYIDTKYIFNDDVGVSCDFSYSDPTRVMLLMGTQNLDTSVPYGDFSQLLLNYGKNNRLVITLPSYSSSSTLDDLIVLPNIRHSVSLLSNGKLKLNNELRKSVTPSPRQNTYTLSFYIFARNEYKGVNNAVGFFIGKIYAFSFYENKKEIIKYIPCLDPTGTPCMFDTVSRQPFYNQGTGAFIAGVENQVQLNNLLRKLPDRTGQDVGTLQVRLADELQTPENEAKLDAMLAKNWEISQAA